MSQDRQQLPEQEKVIFHADRGWSRRMSSIGSVPPTESGPVSVRPGWWDRAVAETFFAALKYDIPPLPVHHRKRIRYRADLKLASARCRVSLGSLILRGVWPRGASLRVSACWESTARSHGRVSVRSHREGRG